jgi:hypothetical protein
MALPPLNAPPLRSPLVDKRGYVSPVWAQWFDLLWRKTGEASSTAPISVTGSSTSVPPMQVIGAPTVTSDPGAFATDPDTGNTYYNPTGDPDDWVEIA